MRWLDQAILIDLLADSQHAGQFSMLLGAGCSVSAGIPAAGSIAKEAMRRLFESHYHQPPQDEAALEAWFARQGILQDAHARYSDALEQLRPTPRLRRLFLESFIEGKKPSPAHWALARVVQAGIIRQLYTTNFDDLVEQSLGQLTKLRVVSYDEQVSASGDNERQPTLFKLHGDYLFDRLQNTQEELKHLGPSQAAKLEHACTGGGLVVVGYSGGDASIMDVLSTSATRGIPLGLYWLNLSGNDLSPNVVRLMESSQDCHVVEIDGFDDFAARLNEAVARTSNTIRAERALIDRGDIFVSHDGGVGRVAAEVRTALLNEHSRIVCLTGLPGVGKTATARRLAASIEQNFSALVLISGKDRILTSSDIIDECHLQLPIQPQLDTSNNAIVQYLRDHPTLILFDNLDEANISVFDFIADLPRPSRALVTVRDARALRSRIPHIWEVEHPGLTKAEMADMLSLWLKRSPTLSRKIGGASPDDIERLLVASKGWPEAMVMMLATLSNTLLHINDIESHVKGNVYQSILGGLYSELVRTDKRVLLWSGAFPVSFTIEGLSQIIPLGRKSVEGAVERLVGAHLLKELFVGQFTWAHPIVREFVAVRSAAVDRPGRRKLAAKTYVEDWARTHGGQPKSDWSNFAQLDKEFENLKHLMESAFEAGDFRVVTAIYRTLFSYIVERGFWTFTEAWCERMHSRSLAKSDMSDWLIWWSWIKYYLRRDYDDALTLAERALALNPRENRQKFEAHRRALVAAGMVGDYSRVDRHRNEAAKICARAWAADSDQAVDLLNSEASARLAIGRMERRRDVLIQAISIYERAERLARREADPNTREIGIAMLGQASCLSVLRGQDAQALDLAQRSLGYAWKVSWLRGIAEANELVAELADRLGRKELAQSAKDVALRMSSQLRSTPYRNSERESE